MDNKTLIAKVYLSISTDSTITSKLGLPDSAPDLTLDDRIRRTKQLPNIVDSLSRIAIWETEPQDTDNPKLKIRTLVISLFVSNEEQNRTGISYELAESLIVNIKELFRLSNLTRTPISTSRVRINKAFNLRTAYGWFKSEVRFEYNSIE